MSVFTLFLTILVGFYYVFTYLYVYINDFLDKKKPKNKLFICLFLDFS